MELHARSTWSLSPAQASCALSSRTGCPQLTLNENSGTTCFLVHDCDERRCKKGPQKFLGGKQMSNVFRGARAAACRASRLASQLSTGLLVVALGSGLASAQTYPERNITLIVPFAAGGASDVSSRIMGESMSKTLGQTIVIENVAGAGGVTGTVRGKSARPDGYTIGFGHMGTHSASVAVNPKLPYDPRTDFD